MTATFDSAAIASTVEDFDRAINDVAVSADATTNKLAAVAHGLANGTLLYVRAPGGVLPSPLLLTVPYFVVNAAADDFQISTTFGGAAVDLADVGLGELSVRADPRRYWYGPDFNPTI